jgi:hypothetical protein
MTKKELIDKLNELRSLSAENELVEFKEKYRTADTRNGQLFKRVLKEYA